MNNNIINKVFNLVQIMEKKEIDGREKKEEVLKTLKSLIGEEEYNKTESILNYIIETVIFISKVSKVSGINENSYLYCCKK